MKFHSLSLLSKVLPNILSSLDMKKGITSTGGVANILGLLTIEGRLEHFMCALPEQLYAPFPNDFFVSLKYFSNSLRELNMTVCSGQWASYMVYCLGNKR